MNNFNRFYKFGSEVKPKASLYCLGITFFLGATNFLFGITTIDIITLIQIFMASFVIALIEYFFFNNYDDLSIKQRNKRTVIWAILLNLIIISSAIIFAWFPTLPLWGNILLLIILEIALVAMRYSIYVVNLADTKDLNNKLHKYQNKINS